MDLKLAARGGVALAIILVTATTASAGSRGLGGYLIRIGPEGISPATVRLAAYHVLPSWANDDSVAHTVSFADGRCEALIPPGGVGRCANGTFMLYAGTYDYRLSDASGYEGQIIVTPLKRTLTMLSSRATVRAGQAVTLHGTLVAGGHAPFFHAQYPRRITIFRRLAGSQRFIRIQQVVSQTPPGPCNCTPGNIWSLTLHPSATATYLARVIDPPAKRVHVDAESQRITVRVTASSSAP